MSIEGAWKLWTDGIQQYGNARNALSSMPQQGVNALNTPRKESPMDLYLDRVDRARREALDKASVLFAGRNVQADQIITLRRRSRRGCFAQQSLQQLRLPLLLQQNLPEQMVHLLPIGVARLDRVHDVWAVVHRCASPVDGATILTPAAAGAQR